ncbi:N-acetylmuramoyl-L-alanine amidase [Streptomyces camponoticapitis]|uniref:N-acetylmuramoyl-L-alanine amidase n=1 Tax=Streptomyces camponoticapitis TaxID=1616125 RepID=A0ABQ2ESA5_9ACTN|nr:N-acetylmuramoyl-L-alanine amidase [Streptomyces camponoticapitis]GGK19535.1 N-acetylmuramoyl-L-alanine amidase [Streptomyces camponoticapitis]
MVATSGPGRRTVLRGGLTATAVGALGLAANGPAHAAPVRADSPPASGSPLAAPEPRIYTTAEWGARPPNQQIVVLDRVPTYIVVHHTAEPGNSEDYSLEHAMAICRSIQNFHMDGQGWGDSGQQFTNSRGGYILEGRHQSLDVVRGGTQHVQGANVGGRNSEVIGIENEGLYTQVDVPAALWGSLVQLVAWIATQYGRPVTDIMGHRDFNSTECPGDVLYGRLQELRDAVAGALGVAPAGRPSVWPLLRPGSAGPQVRAAQYLLRGRGFSDVPVDGVFGAATKRAVAKLADVHNVEKHTCAAMVRGGTDETGYLGSDIWPLITPEVRAGENADVARAVTTLHRAGADKAHSDGVLTAADWKLLLA